jgi:hypothetical protein
MNKRVAADNDRRSIVPEPEPEPERWRPVHEAPEPRPSDLELLSDRIPDPHDPLDAIEDMLDRADFEALTRHWTLQERRVAFAQALLRYDAEQTAAATGASLRTVSRIRAAIRRRLTELREVGTIARPAPGVPVGNLVACDSRSRRLLVGDGFRDWGLRVSQGLGINTPAGMAAALESGELTRIVAPSECVVEPGRDHPGGAVYVVVRPGTIGDEAGTVTRLHPGDVITASEARAAGGALQRLVLEGAVVEVPADRGLFQLYRSALWRAERAEQQLGWLVGEALSAGDFS